MKKFCLIMLIVSILCSSCNFKPKEISEDNEIKISEYEPKLDGYQTSYIIDGNTEKTTEEQKSDNMLYLSGEDILYLDFGGHGNDFNVILNIYYDYEKIDFIVLEKTDYVEQYAFKLENNTRIRLPIKLDNKALKSDNKIHKLLVTFNTGYNQFAKDFESVTDTYGLNAIFDIVHTLDYKDEVYIPNNYVNKFILPDQNYDKNYDELVFNFDYKNVTLMNGNGGVKRPEPEEKIQKCNNIPIMYNFIKSSFNESLIIITLNYEPIKINNQPFQLIKLDGTEGTANGKIELELAKKIGNYEFIGYIVHNPFDKLSDGDGSNLIKSSYRFTLNVN